MEQTVASESFNGVFNRAPGSPELVRVHRFETGKKALPYSRRDYYKIWMTVGAGRIHYATRTITIDQPALIFSNPRVPYSYESEQVDGGSMCIFTEDFLKADGRVTSLQDAPLFRIGGNPVFLLDNSQELLIKSMFDRMFEEYRSGYVHRMDVIRNYVHLIIHEAMKMEPATHAVHYHNASERITAMFLELLERQFPIAAPGQALQLKKAGDYAASLCVHVNHLNHAVKEITGKPTSMHISERILVEAKALLRHTDLSIADIAYCLGFSYPNYFNNYFRKNTGTTPLSFRRLTL